MNLVLASTSPRRKDLLENAGLTFEIIASPADEIHDEAMPLATLCETNASLKARAVADMVSKKIIIGADTLVALDGKPLGKPLDLAHAAAMLRTLSNKTHQVCTGVCVIYPDGSEKSFHEMSYVTFHPLSDEQIAHYHSLVNPLDKAGSYGAQEHAELIIAKIEGDMNNVIGLPVKKLLSYL